MLSRFPLFRIDFAVETDFVLKLAVRGSSIVLKREICTNIQAFSMNRKVLDNFRCVDELSRVIAINTCVD